MKKMSRTYKEMRMIAKIYNDGKASIEVINKKATVNSGDLLKGEAILIKDTILIKGYNHLTGEYMALKAYEHNQTLEDLLTAANSIAWEIQDWDTMEGFYGQGCYQDIHDFFGMEDDEDNE